MTPLFLPVITLALSHTKDRQLCHGTPRLDKALETTSKMFSPVAASVHVVLAISSVAIVSFLRYRNFGLQDDVLF